MINPNDIPKFLNQLVVPPAFSPKLIRGKKSRKVIGHKYKVEVNEFQQQVLPEGFPKTTVWGYGGKVKDPLTGKRVFFQNYPGPTFEAVRGLPVHVEWINNLKGPHLFPVDPTLHWANPNDFHPQGPPFNPFPPGYVQAQSPVPIVTHLHGGENPSAYDGHPETWFTANGIKGPEFVTRKYTYPNKQQPTTLWYHDHALGITRLNVMAGLAGFYLLRDRYDPIAPLLPSGEFEIPLAIQDRTFNEDGSFFYDQVGVNPDIHPYWVPEFFGNTIVVNGKVWPNLNVKPRQYRFRILNGSNARFYNLSLSNNQSFTQIGSDGGYLPEPVELNSLLIAPGERADVLIDFSLLAPGTQLILTNDANAPFPDGSAPDPNTGQVMQFTVISDTPTSPNVLPSTLNTIPDLTPSKTRTLTLVERMGPNGPVELLLNGQPWDSPVTELPRAGTTEEWQIVNTTGDTHPIHLHLVQFLLKNRQDMDTGTYLGDWIALNGGEEPPYESEPKQLPVESYLTGPQLPPPANESGWKDTIQMNPGQVTRILVRFTSQDGSPYPFNTSAGPGYVWHCHILEHEDNEMMRPYKLEP
ncbi:multicopper oxidase [Bacillus sp. FJAT-27251]|uniref:multicopper oxidase family protein n=1 Tax=Bacillus sp. FJAT-27251 TaxID=1684142 RepID=UPI000B2833E7|nr:multicopper oxidase [Bacillus sp. FJAT-27251]